MSRAMKGTIVVLGAGGFIGSRILEQLLNRNYKAVGTARSLNWRTNIIDISPIILDVLKDDWKQVLRELNPTVIINCIAHGNSSNQQNKYLTYQLNVAFLGEILEFSNSELKLDAFIHLGSSSEYGTNCNYADENFELQPNSDYSAAKGAGSLLVKYFGKQKAFPVVSLRLFSVYGPMEDPTRLIPQLLFNAQHNKYPALVNGAVSRDFVFVDDVFDAILLAIEKIGNIKGEVINICSGNNISISELSKVVKNQFGISNDPNFGAMHNRTWDLEKWYGNPQKALKLIQWKVKTSLEDGLIKTHQWMIDNNRYEG